MYALWDAIEGIEKFVDSGGPILLVIGFALLVMWTLILERLWYYRLSLRKDVNSALDQWEARAERRSKRAHQVREALISEVTVKVDHNLDMIKTLVALAPLLGLLGTVTGMIKVFEILAITGGGDAKSMAGGVSQATIPTMAGMVAALSGVFGDTYINRIANREKQLLADHLTMDH
ncbi:MAG: MotA/TolQ/ExbB proton channel family protein [bacterium]